MIRSSQGRSLHKCIFQLSGKYKSEYFPQSWRNRILKLKPIPVFRIMERFILEVNSYYEVSKTVPCSVSFMLTLIFIYHLKIYHHNQRVALEKYPLDTMPKRLKISNKSCLFFNIFIADLYSNALIREFFQIFLVKSLTLGECIL